MRPYNFLLENLILPAGDVVLGTDFIGCLKRWRRIQWLKARELQSLQRENLKRVLQFATTCVAHYKARHVELASDPYVSLARFPVIYKRDLKSDPDAFISGDKQRLICSRSSGSSGIQGAVYMTKKEESESQAIQTLWWEWAGFRIGDRFFQRGMTTDRRVVKRVKDILLRTTYVSAYQLDEKDAVRSLEHLRRVPHRHMGGYASSLYVFAKLARDLGIEDVQFDAVIAWGDKLFPHYRDTIQRQFNCHVSDTYGCTEGLMIAGQCERGVYHIMSPHVYLELLDENDRPVRPGEIGRVVVTRLDNFSMPLIRYALGDLAQKSDSVAACGCNREFPTLARVIGRETDVVRTPSGKHLIVHFFTGIMEYFQEIKQFRVVQRRIGEVEIEYIPDTGFRADILAKVRETMHEKLGEPFPILFREVSQIPSSPSGKPEIVKSEMAWSRK